MMTLFLVFTTNQATPSDQTNQQHLIIHCNIFNTSGALLRRFPGNLCLFENDGSLLMANNHNNELSFLDPKMRLLWKKPMHTHHQLNKASDGDFLVLSSETKIYRHRKTRFDRLLKINRAGEIVATFNFYDHKNEILNNMNRNKFQLYHFEWDENNQDLGIAEVSHINSFYEIPSNKKSHLFPELTAGNFIFNPNNGGLIMILDHNLTHILKFLRPPADRIHDVQITKNGEVLLYNNQVKYGHQIFSELQIYSYPEMKLIWNYHRDSNEFNNPSVGGVQLLDNNEMLFSDIHDDGTKSILLNLKTKKEIKVIAPEGFEKRPSQQVKMENLESFLKLNKGP